MFKERPSRNPVPVSAETVLSNEIKLEGRLHSSTNIRFDGEMTGDVSTDGDLAVGEHGRIKGNVTGRNVVVGGSIQGNVQTSGRLEILATGKVYGDIAVGSLIIDEGGILRGKSAVHADDQATGAPAPVSDFTTVAA